MIRTAMDNNENTTTDAGADAGDELSATYLEERHTPQYVGSESAASSAKPTPYANLRQLAGLIRQPSTPRGQWPSNTSRRPSATPMLQSRATPGSRLPLQSISHNRSHPTTPHTIRALQQRRNTPGFERRKSGRIQRETPRDILRNLSRALALTDTRAPSYLATSIEECENTDQGPQEFVDELSPEQPMVTLPDGRDDWDIEDDFDVPLPRISSQLEGRNSTGQPLEIARRASKEFKERAGMFANNRSSEQYHLMPTTNDEDIAEQDTGTVQLRGVSNDIDELGDDIQIARPSGDTETLRNLLLARALTQQSDSGDSATTLGMIESAPSPFVLQIPGYAPRESDRGIALIDTSAETLPATSFVYEQPVKIASKRPRRSKSVRLSRHGIPFSNIPSSVTKSMADSFIKICLKRRSKLERNAVDAVKEVGDLFLAQLGDDLGMIARHAGRKSIDETDLITAMTRQKHVTKMATAFSLAEAYLPSDLVHKLRVPALKRLRRRRKRSATDLRVVGDEFQDVL